MKRMVYCSIALTVFVCAVTIETPADLVEGLIAAWLLNEGKGSVMKDAVGDHDGEIDGGVWTENAKNGKSAYRLTHKTLITVKNSVDIDRLDDGFTIAHWINPKQGGAIMDKSGHDGSRIQWYILNDRRHHWGIGPVWGISDGNPVAAFHTWYHFAWSHEPDDASIIYRNGKEVGRNRLGAVPVTGRNMLFGNRLPWEGRQEWFNGILDDIGFWNRPLSEEEVNELIEVGLPNVLGVAPQSKLATTWATLKTYLN
ncbi:MAG: LamG domain-containing protein [Candidatus Poribacteria bacterium]|nr:LamG domain-containing protein [Candidatus Poribacteria bacterium]